MSCVIWSWSHDDGTRNVVCLKTCILYLYFLYSVSGDCPKYAVVTMSMSNEDDDDDDDDDEKKEDITSKRAQSLEEYPLSPRRKISNYVPSRTREM